MSSLDILNHLVNFALPALVVALLVTLAARFFLRKAARAPALWAQAAINTVAGALVLGGGLWFFGNDGKMASYAGLVLVVASTQWLMLRGWKG
jgi:hypothetical protein